MTTPSASYPPIAMTLDFNGDGHPDLVTSSNGFVEVFLGDGTGALTPASGQSPYIASGAGNDLTVADFNADGISDFAAANGEYSDIKIFLGNPAAVVAPKTLYPGSRVYNLRSADVNGDGKAELVLLGAPAQNLLGTLAQFVPPWEIQVMEGDGAGAYQGNPYFVLSTFSYKYSVPLVFSGPPGITIKFTPAYYLEAIQ